MYIIHYSEGVFTMLDSDVCGSLVLPKGVFIENYLKEYLESYVRPEIVTYDVLIDIGVGALSANIAAIEEYNMGLRSGRRRVPDRLGFDDVAIIMMSLFTFKNIQLSKRIGDSMLGMYMISSGCVLEGTYSVDTRVMFEIIERIAPNYRDRDMQDVLDKIERGVETVVVSDEKHLFAVNNGIYNQQTQELMSFSPDYVTLNKIPVDYVENPVKPIITANDGYVWDVESWLSDLFNDDVDTTELMWQVISDSMQPNVLRHKSIWFYSTKGNNGKGTVGQLIKNLLGEGNYSSLSVADFNHEFKKESLIGTSANIADENDVNIYIDSVSDFKATVTGDDININRKYEKSVRLQYKGTNIQMMNGLPKTKDKTDSFYRRILLVPFLKSFTNNGERKYIKDDYINRSDVLEYVLYKALHTVFDEFITPDVSADLLDDYMESNDPVREFWNEYKDRFVWDLLPNPFLYSCYKSWYNMNNPSGRVMSNRSFLDSLRIVITSQGDMWEDRSTSEHNVASSGRMVGDEPIISELDMVRPDRNGTPSPWGNNSYTGSDEVTQRDFRRRATYRGFVRL